MTWLRKHAAKVLVFLLLGAIVNVAVAWFLTINMDPARPYSKSRTGQLLTEKGLLIVERFDAFGSLFVKSGLVRSYLPDDTTRGELPLQLAPRWSGIPKAWDNFSLLEQRDRFPYAEGHGWPMLSMFCRWQTSQPRVAEFGRMTTLSWQYTFPGSTNTRSRPKIIPLGFIWPGFAINTIFYVAILWLFFAALSVPGKLRRFIRTKRHRCPGCGYPIGVSPVCTECGVQLPSPIR